jgi:hypothetical protein
MLHFPEYLDTISENLLEGKSSPVEKLGQLYDRYQVKQLANGFLVEQFVKEWYLLH